MPETKPSAPLPPADPIETLINPTYEMLSKAIHVLSSQLAAEKIAMEQVRRDDPGFTFNYLRAVSRMTTTEMRIASLKAYQQHQASIAFLGAIALTVAVDLQKQPATSVDAGAGHGD